MIREIAVYEHQAPMDNHATYSQEVKSIIASTLSHADLKKVDVFNMKGEDSHVQTGDKHRLVILANHPQVDEGALIITHPATGVEVANFIEKEDEYQQLNILIDVFGTYNDENKALFTHIIKELDTLVFYQRILDYSWIHTSKKAELTERFTTRIKEAQTRFVQEDKRKIENIENDIRTYTRELKNKHDNRIRLLRNIDTAEAQLASVDGKLITDLDNIVTHPKVKDLMIQGENFVVETEPIYAYHDKNGSRYYIGNMRIEMNPSNTEVKFFGDNPRRSYWTEKDPHPHVNGRDGRACLGNISSTIAELSSQMELYALTMICIDFLESVNTDDSAGRNIINWDKVDEAGNILVKGGTPEAEEETWTCEHCETPMPHDAEEHRVYRYLENGNLTGERYVCNDCFEELYHWSEYYDEYVHNNIEEPEEEE